MRWGWDFGHEVIVGVERRRNWSEDLRLSTLREFGVGGVAISRKTPIEDKHSPDVKHSPFTFGKAESALRQALGRVPTQIRARFLGFWRSTAPPGSSCPAQ